MTASILLTYRKGDTNDREANLIAILSWLERMPQYEVILVEQDSAPSELPAISHPNCRKVFAYNPGPFNKAWGFNVGACLAQQGILVFSDADLIAFGMLDTAVLHCRSGYAVVKPYRRILDLGPDETARVRAGQHDFLPSSNQYDQFDRTMRGENFCIAGGMFVIRAEQFWRIGGWDERFRGWGGEDDAFSLRIMRERLPTVELDELPALHLWHPRSVQNTFQQPHYEKNKRLVSRYWNYSDAELERLSEVHRQAVGDLKKYEPV